MTLIQALLRRLTARQPVARTLVPLTPEQLKAVSGGGSEALPRSGY